MKYSNLVMFRPLRIVVAALLLASVFAPVRAGIMPPAEEGVAHVNNVYLHYKLQGDGDPIVFVHGLLQNYQLWDSYVTDFAPKYRVLTYSRRYDWPNQNRFTVPGDAAGREVDDLYWLIRSKRLGRVHLVGHSYGAIIALRFAIKHPDMVRTLTICEPPLVQWLLDRDQTQSMWDDFVNKTYIPTKRDLLADRPIEAVHLFGDWLQQGWLDSLSQADLDAVYRSSDDLKSVILATGGFPTVSHADLQRLNCPVLLITGEKSLPFYANIQKQLAIDLGGVPVVTIAGAGHNMAADQPQSVQTALGDFLAQHVRR